MTWDDDDFGEGLSAAGTEDDGKEDLDVEGDTAVGGGIVPDADDDDM